MNRCLRICLFSLLFVLSSAVIKAQTPTDGIMMEKGQICFAALYTHDTWDEYWEGTLKRSNGNVGTLTRQSVMGMFALGISDRLNIIGALPWVKTSASGGQMKGASGFQDLGLWVKATATQSTLGKGIFSTHATIGFTLPTSDYLEDYMPFSLGLGCPDFSLRGILNYQLDSGPYIRGTAAYNIRGTATIERDFYYTDQPNYSDKVDMPNALSWGATVGAWLFDNALQIEATYDAMNTIGGFDIRRQDAGFPSNNMEFTRVGGFAHYHFSFLPGLGIIAQYQTILTGRNIGQSSAITGGISYQFGLWNTEKATETIN